MSQKKLFLEICLRNSEMELVPLSQLISSSAKLVLEEGDSDQLELRELESLVQNVLFVDQQQIDNIVDKYQPQPRYKPRGLSKPLLDSIPGLTGEIASWINQHAQKVQPSLSVGAAISLIGLLKGHRVQSVTGLRTNNYLLGIANAGDGKEHPSRMIQLLMHQADYGLLQSGEPTSDAGLLRALAVNNGRSLILWDEIGHALSSLTAKNASPHEKKIIKVILQLFSKANSVYTGKEYGNRDGRAQRQDINQPHLCLWGTTVPERFFSALTSENAIDGFLPRWLILYADNPDCRGRDMPVVEEAPEELVEALRGLKFLPTNVRAKGNIDAVTAIRPAIIPFDPFAIDEAADSREEFHQRMIKSREQGRGIDSLWARAQEHTVKIALTICDGDKIGVNELRWSRDFVRHTIEQAERAMLQSVAENDLHRKQLKILEIIQTNPGIKQSDLWRKTSWAIAERQKIVEALLTSEQVELREMVNGRGRPSKRYYPV